MRVRFTIYNEEVENTVNDRLKKKLLCFERALSTLEGYEGWMIGTTTLHLDWQPKQGENEFCHTKLTPEIIKKGRSAIRVRIAAAEEEKERENEEMEVLLVKPRQSVLVPEKEKMPLMKAITELVRWYLAAARWKNISGRRQIPIRSIREKRQFCRGFLL